MDVNQFKGVFPAFYACYDDEGHVSEERTIALADYLYQKEVKGLYVGGSSGECIYQNLDERKETLRIVAERLKGKLTLIAHVGAPSTRDSIELAKYAEALGYDALSAIPPIYFILPDESVMSYWLDIVKTTSLPFIVYNIPQLTGYHLTEKVLGELIKNPKVVGVKNSSMSTMDIERFKYVGGEDFLVFNGPDEQFIAGRAIGATGGIGGTYAAMPELFLAADKAFTDGNLHLAQKIQQEINNIIQLLVSQNGHMYAVIKEILRQRGVNVGSVRAPLKAIKPDEVSKITSIKDRIDQAIDTFTK
ncbi:dihydrodipicolinate synthase family protein [Halolactibacillus sp. JCM 19043]|uniref:dihydrodipicolinate synthase family protein n=1 Tax=Halolactibacillus sp. JCM 19043 TaxID=1460638 RepID=UPI00078075F2|nr:dihydrodipicolinate synthase family protein [Halolactibacillus sp. JCM 19043]